MALFSWATDATWGWAIAALVLPIWIWLRVSGRVGKGGKEKGKDSSSGTVNYEYK